MLQTAALEVVHGRHNHGIDPGLHIWGWEIPVYLFLGGLAAGLIVLPALLELGRASRPLSPASRIMPFVAIIVLSLGMGALFLDLEFPSHVFRFFLAFQPLSPMSWGSWILVLVYPAAFLLGSSLLTENERHLLGGGHAAGGPISRFFDWLDRRRNFILWGSIAAGVALGAYTGLLLGTLSARPGWNSALLGPLFLVSGLSTGAAFLLLFRPGVEEQHKLVRWDMMLIVAELAILALVILDLATGQSPARQAVSEFFGGRYTGPFWSLVVFTGLLLPLIMEWIESRRSLTPAVLAPLLILVGGFSLRWILVAAGQASSFGMH